MLSSVGRSSKRKPEFLLSVEDKNKTVACADGHVGGGRRAGHCRRQTGVNSLASRNLVQKKIRKRYSAKNKLGKNHIFQELQKKYFYFKIMKNVDTLWSIKLSNIS